MTFLSGCVMHATDLQGEAANIARTASSRELSRRSYDLGNRVRWFSEEVVTQTYISTQSPDERMAVLDIVRWSGLGDGRFLPLLFYVVQFSENPAERAAAARLMADLKQPPSPFRKSSIIWVIGEGLARESSPGAANTLAYSLNTFLRQACHYEIPDSEDVVGKAPMFGNIPIHVTNTEVMRSWWETTGRAMAAEGRFDEAPSSQPS